MLVLLLSAEENSYAIAGELNVSIVVLSLLSRRVQDRPDHRPLLSDFIYQDAIEQNADDIMFLYRDDVYFHNSPEEGITELIIAKQRNGTLGTIRIVLPPETVDFCLGFYRKSSDEN